MNFKLNSIIKIIIHVLATILFVTLICGVINLNNRNTNLNSENNSLMTDISIKKEVINNLTNSNEELSSDIVNYKDMYDKSQDNNETLTQQVKDLLNQVEELKQQIKEEAKNHVVIPPRSEFKTYMSYKAITNRTTRQWKLQQQATTNEDGVRCIDGIPMVAVGTGWGLSVGDIALVTCENGNSFTVMIGDIKSDRHTDAERKTSIASGCRCEFIVDISKLDPTVRLSGNMATLSKYSGYVINIEKVS